MTPKQNDDQTGDDGLGVLDDSASLDDTGIGFIGSTAQVDVTVPTGGEEELDVDDDVVLDEVAGSVVAEDLVIDRSGVADEEIVQRLSDETTEIVIELPVEAEVVEVEAAELDEQDDAVEPDPIVADEPAPLTAEVVLDADEIDDVDADGPAPDDVEPDDVEPDVEPEKPAPIRHEVAAPHVDEAASDDDEDLDIEPPVEQDQSPDRIFAEILDADTDDVPGEDANVDTDDQQPGSAVAGAPLTRSEAHRIAEAQRAAEAQRTAEIALTSRRIGDASRESSRESADLLTPERLLDPSRLVKPEPEGAWSHFLYTVSGRRINIGDGRKARARKELSARIAGPLQGSTRFVPVLSRKGGVGKTTVTALLGMALADARDDRVIAVDANPDRGTLADRIVGDTSRSVRDLVRAKDDIRGFHDISALVARDHTRLDVLASDSDPHVAEAFGDEDYRDVAAVAEHFYSLVLTDTGTGIVHDVMQATLDLADQIVIVSGLSVDEARLASETLTWLETNGHAEKARDAIVVLNQSTPGTPLVRLNEIQAHFSSRVGHVVRIPYDSQIAGGGAIVWTSLAPETRLAARELAALLVGELRAGSAR